MAGMFYSLKETADRLGKTEDEVRQLTKGGKLREFRDGSHVLFKVDEVNALLAEGIDVDLDAAPLELAAPEEFAEGLDIQPPATPEGAGDDDVLNLLEEEPTSAEPVAEAEASSEMELVAEPDAGASSEMELAAEPEAEASSEMDLAAESGAGTKADEDDLLFLDEGEKTAGSDAEKAADTDEEIALAPETGAETSGSDITDMDTALTGEGVNVLGETDTGYDVTDDSMAETAGPASSAGATGTGTGTGAGTDAEASLEEIEDDVNLDSFGSGSGLLDLSLQADDTSLGGILDEIYTAEGGEEGAGVAAGEPGSVEDITAEVDQAAPEEELAAPEVAVASPAVAAAAYPAYAETAPDTQSNILGMLLLLPLLALLYTTIVAISGQRHVVPSILSSIQGMIWYIVGGLAVVSVLVFGATFVMGGERTKTAAPKKVKEPKAKAAKAEKPAREKAAEKPAKAKKGFSLFGKKKEKKK